VVALFELGDRVHIGNGGVPFYRRARCPSSLKVPAGTASKQGLILANVRRFLFQPLAHIDFLSLACVQEADEFVQQQYLKNEASMESDILSRNPDRKTTVMPCVHIPQVSFMHGSEFVT